MTVSCPDCGSRYLRASRISPLRCGDCGTRFVARTWYLAVITHSRCPKCLRMDLNGWTEQQYWPGSFMKLPIRLGAPHGPNRTWRTGARVVSMGGKMCSKKNWFQVIRSSA
jgi:DNA-directed RNA polymerase subunit RPC12/RpoP